MLRLFSPGRFTLHTDSLPFGALRYASLAFASEELGGALGALLRHLSRGLEDPKVTYIHGVLQAGQTAGNPNWHWDGHPRLGSHEIHRLLCFGPEPTEIPDGLLLPGYVWEYGGTDVHRAVPALKDDTRRLILRVSQTPHKRPVNTWLPFQPYTPKEN